MYDLDEVNNLNEIQIVHTKMKRIEFKKWDNIWIML
jgi:hypothetical protein